VKRALRTALVAVLVTLTGIVAPVSVVAPWAYTQVSDTEAFVSAYAPLSRDPAVRQAMATRLSEAIQTRLDLPSLTEELLGGLAGSSRIASRLLPSLTGPLNSMVSDFIDTQVTAFVTSEAFSQVWEVALRTTHTQFVALVTDDRSGPLAVTDGTVQVQLAPFVEAVKQRLVANGFPLAERIPAVDTAIDLVQLDPVAVARAQAGYRLLSAVSEWLPWLLLLLPALALVLARRTRATVIACGLVVSGSVGVAWLAIRAVIEQGATLAARNGLPGAAVTAITDGSLGPMRGPAMALIAVGLVVAGLAWLTDRKP
jgi:hypothetical protein